MRIRVRFTGRVQGVGFRATARSIAARHPVTGWVRNDADGSVLMEVQGASECIRAMIDELRLEMHRTIRSAEETPIADTGQEVGFEIRH